MLNLIKQFRTKASTSQKKVAGALFAATAVLAIFTVAQYATCFYKLYQHKAHERAINAKSDAERDRQGVKGIVWADNAAELEKNLAAKPNANWVALTSRPDEALMAGVGKVSDLRILTSIDPGIDDDNLRHVAKQTELRRVSFWKSAVTDKGVVHLKDMTKLEDLSLTSQVTDEGLAQLKGLSSLRRINLSDSVSGVGLVHLADLPDLRSVGLHGTVVTDDSIANLSRLGHLESINLYGTAITDKGVKHLAACKGLKDVYIPKTGITDKGLQELASLEHLETVNVCETAVTEAGVASFLKTRPDVKVNYGEFSYLTPGVDGLLNVLYASVGSILALIVGFRLETYMRRTVEATT